jgi:septum formation protein
MSYNQGMKRLVLASSSPRRKELLKQIGLDFDVIPSSVPEKWEENSPPRDVTRKLAMDKAADVAAGLSSGIVIGADTIVLLKGRILGKPKDPDDAFKILSQLSGNFHEVITAVALIEAETGRPVTFDATTRVFFREITKRELHAYIATGEPMDKAGAYGIQGKGILFVRRIEGCYTNVVGLPITDLAEKLSALGVRVL